MKLTLKSAAVAFDLGVVTVRIQKKAYILHEKLLTEHSEYFRCRLEWNDGPLTLNDFDDKAFEVFIN